jgi:hypothetical protein
MLTILLDEDELDGSEVRSMLDDDPQPLLDDEDELDDLMGDLVVNVSF